MAGQAGWSRRAVLRGAGAAGLAALLGTTTVGCAPSSSPPSAAALLRMPRFHIAHRGAGDEAPEHTLAAYTRIVDRGARAVEISVHRTADGVLVCHHDATLERTTGHPGAIAEMSYADVEAHRVDMRRTLGPGWEPQPVPRLDDVLARIGGRTVLFVEAKDPAATTAVIDAVVARGLRESTVFKHYYRADGDDEARAAGLLVWNYYDPEATEADVTALAARSDAIGAEANNEPADDRQVALARAAVATGKPVIAWAMHRRAQVEQLAALGVQGFMSSSWSYLALAPTVDDHDSFDVGRVAPGDLPVSYTASRAPVWDIDGSIALADPERVQSLSLGSMCPITHPTYTVRLEMCFDALPPDRQMHAGLVIGRRDDAPYLFNLPETGTGHGQMVILRGSGSLEVRDVPPDNGKSALLAQTDSEDAAVGRWEQLEIRVEADRVVVTRTPTASASSSVTAPRVTRGGYVVLTRNYAAPDAAVRFRGITVEPGP